ncbi:hypothetical protein JCM1841_006642 [Sporobolomyces salmonicolor]
MANEGMIAIRKAGVGPDLAEAKNRDGEAPVGLASMQNDSEDRFDGGGAVKGSTTAEVAVQGASTPAGSVFATEASTAGAPEQPASPFSAHTEEPTEATRSSLSGNSGQSPSLSPEVPLSLPSAAQPRKPSTPPRLSKTPAMPSSSSSGDTITRSERPTMSSPSSSTYPLTQTEVAEDSPDPLRIIPSSSAAIPTVIRSRSQSLEPTYDRLQSSPSRASSARPRSKTPLPSLSAAGENLKPTPFSAASKLKKGKKAAILDNLDVVPEAKSNSSSADELNIAPTQTSQRATASSSFEYVDIPVSPSASTSRGSRLGTRARATSRSGGRSPSPRWSSSPRAKHAASDETADRKAESSKRQKMEPTFEIVIETGFRGSPTPGTASPVSSRASTPKRIPSQSQPHPLSEVAFATRPNSSPLTSLPPSTTGFATSPAAAAKRKRRRPSSQKGEAPIGLSDTDDDSSSALGASPKKKKRTLRVSSSAPADETSDEGEAVPSTARSRGKGEAVGANKTGKKKAYAKVGVASVPHKAPVRSRRSTGRVSLKEVRSSASDEEETSEADVEASPEVAKKRSKPPKAPLRPANSSAASRPKGNAGSAKGKAKEAVKPASKGKGKVNEVDYAATRVAPSSSPSKTQLHPASSFLSQLAMSDSFIVETVEQRSKDWNPYELDEFVWVHIDGQQDVAEKGGFWWLGRITNRLRSERPLVIELFLDPTSSILKHSRAPSISLVEPSHLNLLKFRSRATGKLRFDKRSFRDSSLSLSSTPSEEAFESVLDGVLDLERSPGDEGGEEEGEDSDDDLPDPSQLGASAGPSSRAKKSSEKATDGSDTSSAARSPESDDELLQEEDETAGMIFPFACIARTRARPTWWAALCTGYEKSTSRSPAKSKKARKPPLRSVGKFIIEWTDGSTAKLTRDLILTSRQRAFFDVDLGKTELQLPKSYLDNVLAYMTELQPTFQRTLNEDYLPVQERNDDFYAGGRRRDVLAKSSAFGELPDALIEAVADKLRSWAKPSQGDRPTGSARYEALQPSERSRYISDVLLPCAVISNHVDDRKLKEDAEKALAVEGNSTPTDEEIEFRAYILAREDLEVRSITKTSESPFSSLLSSKPSGQRGTGECG